MKFEQLTNEFNGARNAGYTLDLTCSHEVDDSAAASVMTTRGESYLNSLVDSLFDNEGDLFRGQDGNLYAVIFDYGRTPAVPVAWQRLRKEA